MKKLAAYVIVLAALVALAVWFVKSGVTLTKGEKEHIETNTGYADEAKKSMDQMNTSIDQTNKAAQEIMGK